MNVLKIFKYYYDLRLLKSFVLPIPSCNFHSLMDVNNCSLTKACKEIIFSLFLLNHLNYDARLLSHWNVGDLISNPTENSFMSQGPNRIWEARVGRCPHCRSPMGPFMGRVSGLFTGFGGFSRGAQRLPASGTLNSHPLWSSDMSAKAHRAARRSLLHEDTMVSTPLLAAQVFLSLKSPHPTFSFGGDQHFLIKWLELEQKIRKALGSRLLGSSVL